MSKAKKKIWKHMEQSEAVQAFAEGELVYVLTQVGSAKLGFTTIRFEGKIKHLLKTHLRVEWYDKQGVVHVDRLLPERLEPRNAKPAPYKRVFEPKRREIDDKERASIQKAIQPIPAPKHEAFIEDMLSWEKGD